MKFKTIESFLIGKLAKADHPITCMNPEETFTIFQVRVETTSYPQQEGHKVFVRGENTCCFVPHEINNLLVKSDSRRNNLPIGVTFNESTNKYTANYSLSGRSKHIGNYETILEAFEAYKRVKETYVRTVTEGWEHLIDQRTYEALMNYQVEVTD